MLWPSEPSTKVAFSTLLSLHWFYEPVPAESRWCELYTWMKHSLPSVLGAPLCCLHLLPPINAHILNMLQSAYAQCGFACSMLQAAPQRRVGALCPLAQRLLGCKESRQREDGSREERREWERGRICKLSGEASGKLPAVSSWCKEAIRIHTQLRRKISLRRWMHLKCAHLDRMAEGSEISISFPFL